MSERDVMIFCHHVCLPVCRACLGEVGGGINEGRPVLVTMHKSVLQCICLQERMSLALRVSDRL